MIKFECVYGTLIVKKDSLIFEPSEDPEHNVVIRENSEVKVSDYGSMIDYFDICEFSKLPLVNEKAILSENSFIQEEYKYDLFIQIILTAVNGVTYAQKNFEDNKIVGALIDNSNNE